MSPNSPANQGYSSVHPELYRQEIKPPVHVHEDTHSVMIYRLYMYTLLINTTEANATVLPVRIPGYKSSDIQLLPSSTTKHQVWDLYQEAAIVHSMRAVSYATFTSLWRQLLPHVVVMKPMSDLCWLCQRNSATITTLVH